MEFSIVENLSGLQESIFSLSRSPQLHFDEKSKKCRIILNLSIFPIPPVEGPLGCCYWCLVLGSFSLYESRDIPLQRLIS